MWEQNRWSTDLVYFSAIGNNFVVKHQSIAMDDVVLRFCQCCGVLKKSLKEFIEIH